MGTPDRREEQENRERREETEEGQWAWPDMESAGFHSFSSAAALFFYRIYIEKTHNYRTYMATAHNYGSVSLNQEAHQHLPVKKRFRILLFI